MNTKSANLKETSDGKRFAVSVPQWWLWIAGGVLSLVIVASLLRWRDGEAGFTLFVKNASADTVTFVDGTPRGVPTKDGKIEVRYLKDEKQVKFSPDDQSTPVSDIGGNGKEEISAKSNVPTPGATPKGMVYVPGGEFTMGSDEGDEASRPVHRIEGGVKPFFIDITEVTNEAYQTFLAEHAEQQQPPTWKERRFPAGQEKYPVTGVTWNDAKAFAQWAEKRLPTEVEWEYAARYPDGRLYPWGNEWQDGKANIGGRQLVPVDDERYQGGKSERGLWQMSGNVWEWTEDTWGAYPGGKFESPAGGRNFKVIRGGAFDEKEPKDCTAIYRGYSQATPNDWDNPKEARYDRMGFRCVKDIR